MKRSIFEEGKNIREQITSLAELSMKELWLLWDQHFDFRPGNHHRSYIESRLAYRIQEVAYGG
jgi:hypothetical protein